MAQLERAMYLRRWREHLPPGSRVLDLGGGVGRFSLWLLEQGCEVELVDPDLRSLWRAVRSAGQLDTGRLDVHWSTGEHLPELAPVDVRNAYVHGPQSRKLFVLPAPPPVPAAKAEPAGGCGGGAEASSHRVCGSHDPY